MAFWDLGSSPRSKGVLLSPCVADSSQLFCPSQVPVQPPGCSKHSSHRLNNKYQWINTIKTQAVLLSSNFSQSLLPRLPRESSFGLRYWSVQTSDSSWLNIWLQNNIRPTFDRAAGLVADSFTEMWIQHLSAPVSQHKVSQFRELLVNERNMEAKFHPIWQSPKKSVKARNFFNLH